MSGRVRFVSGGDPDWRPSSRPPRALTGKERRKQRLAHARRAPMRSPDGFHHTIRWIHAGSLTIGARCTCGQTFRSDDKAEVAREVSGHVDKIRSPRRRDKAARSTTGATKCNAVFGR